MAATRHSARNPYVVTGSGDGGDPSRRTGNQGATLAGLTRIGQVITLAIAQGGVLILAILWFLSSGKQDEEGLNVVLLAIGAGVFVVNAAAAIIIPRTMRAAGIRQYRSQADVPPSAVSVGVSRWDEADAQAVLPLEDAVLLQRDQTARIVGQAILEGAAMVNSVFLVLNSHPIHAVLAVVAVAGIVATIPTVDRLRRFLAEAEAGGSVG